VDFLLPCVHSDTLYVSCPSSDIHDRYGRKPAVLIPYFVAGCFSFGTATAKDIQTILITRFFAGLFGSAPVTNTGGVLGDIWLPQHRGTAVVGYAFAVIGGPTLGASILFLGQIAGFISITNNAIANRRRCHCVKLPQVEMDRIYYCYNNDGVPTARYSHP
jgi:predicted MFS family arabinose efflux permease